MVEFCPLCEKIKEIREAQNKEYYDDLCEDCKIEYLLDSKRNNVLLLS